MTESLDDDLPDGWTPAVYTRQRCLAVLLRRCEIAGWRGDGRPKDQSPPPLDQRACCRDFGR
jgi:hypothetical protein